MAESKGFDLLCGAGQVAALTCPRHVIHSRSRSNPSELLSRTGTHPFGWVPVLGGE